MKLYRLEVVRKRWKNFPPIKYGYSVITAADGEGAITKFMENRERISLVLLDMIMPKKNGKEVGETIRKVRPEI